MLIGHHIRQNDSLCQVTAKEDMMQLANEVRIFSVACEQILSAIGMNRPLTEKEASLLEYYCTEILTKISPSLPKPH